NESGRHFGKSEKIEAVERYVKHQNHARDADQPGGQARVALAESAEEAIETAEKPSEEAIGQAREPILVPVRAVQKDGAERRAERERIERGIDRGYGDGQGKLFVK